ncbi:MAG TPA: class I SAM-dependent methyltransferase [Burkholderiales bacterium]|nr:class I SAM-dependent methyltransferase [Burkholderiales bacterium]
MSAAVLTALFRRVLHGLTPAEAFHAATRATEAGRPEESARLLEVAARRHPRNHWCAAQAGLAHYRIGKYAPALEQFDRAIALDPECSEYRYYAAQTLRALGAYDGALERCLEALGLDHNHPESCHLLSQLTLPGPSYTQVLAALHRALAPRTYLEIGIADGRSLSLVQPSTRAIGIDPEPKLAAAPAANTTVHAIESDRYFATHDVRAELGGAIDFAFIDGLHTFDQALRDFINVERHSTRGTAILLHDTYPLTRHTAERVRRTTFWSGDVWKLVLILKNYRPDLTVSNVAAAPSGLCVVSRLDPESRVLEEKFDAIVAEFMAVDYGVLDANKPGMLNLYPNELERVLSLVTTRSLA